ncbi:MAG: AbrB/MazE/SpoVT family DNA-binding domain-containing protein [Thermomicrobiales bacterium]
MATTFHKTEIEQENELAMPDDIRHKLGLKVGDSVMWSIDDDGTVRVRRLLTLDELAGRFKPLPGSEGKDFDEILAEALEEEADRIVADMNYGYLGK